MRQVAGKFNMIGSEKEDPLMCLEDYISYDEMQISSLVSVASPSFFINSGSKYNNGKKQTNSNFERMGVYVGTVGARFEVFDRMESQHILISKTFNKEENGFGKKRDQTNHLTKKMEIWEKFYRVDHFPTFEEAKILTEKKETEIVQTSKEYFFNGKVYKERIRMSMEPYFLYCNQYSKSQSKGHIRYLGLDWAFGKLFSTYSFY